MEFLSNIKMEKIAWNQGSGNRHFCWYRGVYYLPTLSCLKLTSYWFHSKWLNFIERRVSSRHLQSGQCHCGWDTGDLPICVANPAADAIKGTLRLQPTWLCSSHSRMLPDPQGCSGKPQDVFTVPILFGAAQIRNSRKSHSKLERKRNMFYLINRLHFDRNAL